MKNIATNKKARRDYEIMESIEAGIELKGSEVKSLRTHSGNIDDAFVRIERDEAWLYNFHIPEYAQSSFYRVDPKRVRKLLLHKKEIMRFSGLLSRKGLTIVALNAHFNDKGIVKITIALAKGKKQYDRRKDLKDEITRREVDRAMKDAIKRR